MMTRAIVVVFALACAGGAASTLCLVGLAGLAGLAGCKSLEKSASEDPMKCERDPKCNKKRDKAADCSRQCNDDPACMDRCEQVQAPNGPLGH